LNAHSLGNCILFMHCQHFASYWLLLKMGIRVTVW
jgi:hypothetical protein